MFKTRGAFLCRLKTVSTLDLYTNNCIWYLVTVQNLKLALQLASTKIKIYLNMKYIYTHTHTRPWSVYTRADLRSSLTLDRGKRKRQWRLCLTPSRPRSILLRVYRTDGKWKRDDENRSPSRQRKRVKIIRTAVQHTYWIYV